MKYRAICPVCGWTLMQAAPNSEIIIDCPKCKQHMKIKVEEKENGEYVIACNIVKKEKKVNVKNFNKSL